MAVKGDNEMIGLIGKTFDGLFIKKSLRKCKLIGEENLGEKVGENGTYNGNLGMEFVISSFKSFILNNSLKCFNNRLDSIWPS